MLLKVNELNDSEYVYMRCYYAVRKQLLAEQDGKYPPLGSKLVRRDTDEKFRKKAMQAGETDLD